MSGRRLFGASIAHESVTLVEYRVERAGLRVVGEWTDATPAPSLDAAVRQLSTLLAARGAGKATVAIAVEQFGMFHHRMVLPTAADDVIRTIVLREVQRVFGVSDALVAFARAGSSGEVFIGGAPRETMEALSAGLESPRVRIALVTVVPQAMHALYEASGGSREPTAVLLCAEGGPHLAFFLDGKLELAIDPPIALESERPTVPMILDQVERGAIYFRQQFRGASATRVLLSARRDDYDALAHAVEQRLHVAVTPLFAGVRSPDAVIAMGAVLESQRAAPLDLFPHPPSTAERARAALRGPNRFVALAAAAGVAATLWGASQFVALSRVRREDQALRDRLRVTLPAVEPMRRIAERRGDAAKQVAFVRDAQRERAAVTATLAAVAAAASDVVRFDSLVVTHAPTGWSGTLAGRVTGPTAAIAVRALDAFLSNVRARSAIASAALDQFDYPSPEPGNGANPADPTATAADSTRRVGPVVIAFHMSFTIAAPGASGTPGAVPTPLPAPLAAGDP